MIDDPGLEVLVEPASRWTASGPLADRALEIARGISDRLGDQGRPIGPLRVVVRRAPEAHVGLGVGTQLSLALARGVALLAGIETLSLEDLARLAGRGLRSGIGIHGFECGGFITDGGRGPRSTVPPLLVRQAFPDDWSILVVVPRSGSGLHGPREVEAFRSIERVPESTTQRLSQLVLLGVLPALAEHDLPAFGRSLEDIQECVGSYFSPVQGGIYTDERAKRLVERLKRLGLVGVGQSSWGPTVYGFSDLSKEAQVEVLKSFLEQTEPTEFDAFWTRGSQAGASCRILTQGTSDDMGIGADPHRPGC
jgi:beta-RFAP synthase